MAYHQLAAMLTAFLSEMQRASEAEAAALSQLITQPILERLTLMSVDVTKLTADFAIFRTDLTTTLADARAKMDELQALKVSDAAVQTQIDALDASLGDLEAQVKPPALPATPAPVKVPAVVPAVVPTPADPAPVSTDPAASAPVLADPSAPVAVDPAASPVVDPAASAPVLQQDAPVADPNAPPVMPTLIV